MVWWYHLQTDSKWNIGEFTKTFAGFFRGKKTTHSPQLTGVYIEKITARAPQGSILDPLLFLTYINDITGGLICKTKQFINDTFLLADNTQTSVNDLNKDLKTKNNWAFQWKLNFSPYSTEQAQ